MINTILLVVKAVLDTIKDYRKQSGNLRHTLGDMLMSTRAMFHLKAHRCWYFDSGGMSADPIRVGVQNPVGTHGYGGAPGPGRCFPQCCEQAVQRNT
jgi:hypothetical protein